MESWYLYIIAGVATGIMSALFGVGGGVLMVPILTLAFGFGQKSAQGISLFVILPTALAGALRYKLHPDIPVNLAVAAWMAAGGMAGAILGSKLVFLLPEIVLKRMFAVFIILTGIHIFIKTLPPKSGTNETSNQIEKTEQDVS